MPDDETIQRGERAPSRPRFLWAGSMLSGPLMKAILTPGRLSPDSRQDAGTIVTQLRFPTAPRIFSMTLRICAPGVGIHMDFCPATRLPALNHFCAGVWGVILESTPPLRVGLSSSGRPTQKPSVLCAKADAVGGEFRLKKEEFLRPKRESLRKPGNEEHIVSQFLAPRGC